jgi:hypothetical protein
MIEHEHEHEHEQEQEQERMRCPPELLSTGVELEEYGRSLQLRFVMTII